MGIPSDTINQEAQMRRTRVGSVMRGYQSGDFLNYQARKAQRGSPRTSAAAQQNEPCSSRPDSVPLSPPLDVGGDLRALLERSDDANEAVGDTYHPGGAVTSEPVPGGKRKHRGFLEMPTPVAPALRIRTDGEAASPRLPATPRCGFKGRTTRQCSPYSYHYARVYARRDSPVWR